MLRLFLAVDLPDDVRDVVAGLRSDIKGARWVEPRQLHITLRFMGDTPEETLSTIVERLARVEVAPFSLALGHAGTFPSERRARVLWLSLDPALPLRELESEIDRALAPEGSAAPQKFSPHLTLARLKERPDESLRRFLTQHSDYRGPSWKVECFQLYRSILHANGAQHEMVATYSLSPTRR
jgi:2'-5' RNA ligase